jgi:hypothetical protein
MDNLFLPKSIDNYYRGQKLALWFFWLVVIVRAAQGVSLIVGGHSIVRDADGIPLETFPDAASQSIVGVFVISGGARLVLSLLAVIVFTFYRSAIPFTELEIPSVQLLIWFYSFSQSLASCSRYGVDNIPGANIESVVTRIANT